MTEESWLVKISTGMMASPVESAGDLILAVRSPRGPDHVTVMVNPNLIGYRADMHTPAPGLQVAGVVAMTNTDESVTIDGLKLGLANAQEFWVLGYQYRITLMGTGNEGGSEPPAAYYEFEVRRIADAVEHIEQALSGGQLSAVETGQALLQKGQLHSLRGHRTDALAAFDEVVGRFGGSDEPAARDLVGQALFRKVAAYQRDAASPEAAATYDAIIARFADAPEAQLRWLAASAMLNRAGLISATDPAAAAAEWQLLAERFGGDVEPRIRGVVAEALNNRVITLATMGGADAAEPVYAAMAARYVGADEPEVKGAVASAAYNSGVALYKSGRAEPALERFRGAVARAQGLDTPQATDIRFRALGWVAYVLGALKRDEEAIAVARELLDMLTFASELEHVRLAARTLGNVAFAEERLGHIPEAIAAHQSMVANFGGATDSELREHAAKSVAHLARLQGA